MCWFLCHQSIETVVYFDFSGKMFMQAIVAEPERTIASLQAMLIAAPPVAQEASDVPSTPGVLKTRD
jgi:hypothetical protein